MKRIGIREKEFSPGPLVGLKLKQIFLLKMINYRVSGIKDNSIYYYICLNQYQQPARSLQNNL